MRLAAHFLSYDLDDQLRPVAATLTLEGGQELRLAVEPLPAPDDSADDKEIAGATVAVRYRETAPLRALLLWLRSLRLFTPEWRSTWKPALALVLLALSVAPLGYWSLTKRYASGDKLADATPPKAGIFIPTSPDTKNSPQPDLTTTPIPRPSAPPLTSSGEVIAMDIPSRAGEPLTRGARTQGAGLLGAKKVYLEISGSRTEQARRLLLERLPMDNQFSLTDNPDEADVAIIVTAEGARQDRLGLTVNIRDASGKVIWPLTPGAGRRKYVGPVEKVITTFSRELAADIRPLERQK
jgi:hypothetical protein